jgi:His/Glu/Gln/Arg/opine family amino acid ABC transporter permease subunit
MNDQSYVRTEMLSEQPAPLGQTGVLRWMRENLFSSVLNSIISLVALGAVVYALMGLLPWAIQPSFNATSLRMCIDDPNINGACWGVIHDRFNQLMFGFYPHDAQWRPLLAFFLMLVAIAPVLFDKLPRKMMWFSAGYPFLGVWLLWGGAIWGPLLVVAGFLVGYLVQKIVKGMAGDLAAMILGVLAAIFWWLFAVSPISDTITQTIAESRIEATIQALEDGEAALIADVAQKESLIAALEAPIAEMQTPLKELKEAADAQAAIVEELQAELDADFEPSFLGGTHTQLSDAEVADLEARLAIENAKFYDVELAYSDAFKVLDAQRRELVAAKNDISNATTALRESERARVDMGALPDLLTEADALETQKAEMEAAFEELAAALPESVKGIASLTEATGEVSDEAKAAFHEYETAKKELASLETKVLNVENRVQKAYQLAGLVGLEPIESSKFGGLMLSITIGVSGIALSLPIGIMLALGRQSDMFIIKVLSVGFIEFIRGVPLITLLFVASVLLNFFLPPGTSFDLILRVIIMVTIFASAYMAEVIRGGLAALPKGQYEAADALGLDYWQSMRLIIMPQALKISIPGIVGTFIGLFKDTTLVSIIGLLDPVGLITSIQGTQDWNGIVWELYTFIALMFWVFTFSMSRYSMYLENKLKTTH